MEDDENTFIDGLNSIPDDEYVVSGWDWPEPVTLDAFRG